MERIPFFSVIVPACNIEPFAADMVHSIQAQTDPDFEALLCYETSRDGTLAELRKAIGDDTRFTIVELPCSGSASAGRNYGMEHARGEYAVFLDGDDMLKETALDVLHRAYKQYGPVDLIAANADVVWELHREHPEGMTKAGHPIECGKIMDAPLAMARIMRLEFQPAVWYQIYRLELLKKDASLRQCVSRRHQDEEWTPRVFLAAKTFVKIEDTIYVYRKRENSVTTKTNPKSMRDLTDNLLGFLDYWRTHEIPSCARAALANWESDLFRRYFQPNYCRQYERALRASEYHRLLNDPENFRTLRELLKLSTPAKRCLRPLFTAARFRPLFTLCEFLFLHVYWPLVFTMWGRMKKGFR